MKYGLCISLMLAVVTMCSAQMLQIGLGANVSGKHYIKKAYDGYVDRNSTESELGFAVLGEYLQQRGNLLYGVGAEYLLRRAVNKNNTTPKVGFVPLYLVGKIKVSGDETIKTELIAHAGFDLFLANKEYMDQSPTGGGLYWGMGAAFVKHQFVLQGMYEELRGELKRDLEGETVHGYAIQRHISIMVGSRM